MSITTVQFTFFNKINEFTQWGKVIDISPTGKLETRENKAKTVNTEHVRMMWVFCCGVCLFLLLFFSSP